MSVESVGQRPDDEPAKAAALSGDDPANIAVTAGSDGNADTDVGAARTSISVIVPALNEAENLVETVPETIAVLEEMRVEYEVLVIDDGSTDGTPKVMRQLRTEYPRLRSIRLRSNAGKAAALSVGFDASENAILVTMDADGQDEPREIPRARCQA